MYIDSTFINLFLSTALVIATVVLALATGTLVRETKRMREFQETPRLSIRVEQTGETGKYLNLVLWNEGQGVAKNVRFSDFKGHPISYSEGVEQAIGVSNVIDQPLFKKGLMQWGSGQTFTFLLGSALHEDFAIAAQSPWIFHVQYESMSGMKFNEVLEIDLSFLLGPYIPEVNHLKTISETLSEIHKAVSRPR